MNRKNIQKVLLLADRIDLEEGKLAYHRYHETLHKLAQYYGAGFTQTVAAFSALSPNNDYIGNLRSLVSLLQGVQGNHPVESIKVSTYKAARDRAYSFLIGDKDFLFETKGPKTRNFYMNILKPDDPRFITIDGHMYNVWRGKQGRLSELVFSAKYETIAQDFRVVARKHRLVPNQLQAILWFTWKRVNQILFQHQLNYLKKDVWGLIVEPEDIKPF